MDGINNDSKLKLNGKFVEPGGMRVGGGGNLMFRHKNERFSAPKYEGEC
jgi:hypothetical protein